MSKQTFIIVGASLAGAKAAEELRAQGFDGRVVLIGAEPERPYERPPLTKDYLRGESEREKAFVHEESFHAEHEIELLTSTTVRAIDPASSRVTLDDRRELTYDRLLLTTGAEPRRIPVPGSDLSGVHYLRTLSDCDALRSRLDAGGHVVVVGAGWIGSEFAASPRQRGLDVTVIDPLPLPHERIFGPEIGSFYRDVHARHGVELLLGEGVGSFEGDRVVGRVRTSDDRAIECDFVVVGIGVAPRVELAHQAGLETDDGIVVDERLQTSASNVFAAGDVANTWHAFYGRRIRVEHWANALNQGPAAARAMLGQDVAYERIPYFFSDQYDVGMEYSGYATDWDGVVFRGDRDGGEFIAFWLRAGRVVAGMNVNVWDVNEHVQALIQSREPVDVGALTDIDTPLDSLAAPRRARLIGASMAPNPNLQQLHQAGVSIWLDTLSRHLLESGEFATLIGDYSVTGATSNPTIFAKAITGSDLYDNQLRWLAAGGERDTQELFFSLALDDVREAAGLLRPEYEGSGGFDGFISFECTPDLTDDTDATIAQATDLWERLALPNVMIKVPGTEAGLPAIEELTRRGVNINVTLLFSVARYEQVIDAYLNGLRARSQAGEPLSPIASVASFFLSRIDTKVDARLAEGSPLQGRVALASARVAYQRYLAKFAGPEWERLERSGAKRQRPLWASTGTKNPAYSDVLYVSELVGQDVVNTMPEQTLRAFADHGTVKRTLDNDPEAAERTLADAHTAGIDLPAVTAELEREGVRSFCDSYHELLDCIERKLGSFAPARRAGPVR